MADKDNRLLTAVRGVIEDELEPGVLQGIVKEFRDTLGTQRVKFAELVEELDTSVREQVVTLVEGAGQLFDAMEAALNELDTYFETGNKESLYKGGGLASRTGHQMNLLFIEFRNVTLTLKGPTDIPNLNHLLDLHGKWKKDPEAWFPKFRNVVEGERLFVVASMRDLDNAPDTVEFTALKNAFDEHIRCMNRLAIALDKNNKFGIDKEVHLARTTFTRIRDLLPAAQLSARAKGPTPLPEINLLVNTARDVEHGLIHQNVLIDVLEKVGDSFGQTREELEAADLGPQASALAREELERVRDAFDELEEAFGEFYEFLDNRELMVLRSAIAKLTEAGKRIATSQESFQKIAEREGKVPCIKCQHYNPSDRHTCEKCGAPLPKMAGTAVSTFETSEGPAIAAQPDEGPIVTANLYKVYEAANNFLAEQIDSDEFLNTLDWFEQLVTSTAERIPAPPDPEAADLSEAERAEAGRTKQLAELFDESVDDMLRGLGHLRTFAETGMEADLKVGVTAIDEGAHKLKQVQQATAPAAQQEAR